MNHARNIVAIVLLSLLNTNAFGTSQMGYGNTKCSIYGSIHAETGILGSGIDSWALGYLSGLNQSAIANGATDKLERRQSGRVLAYIRAYCESNTDDTVAQAADDYWARIEGK